MDGIGLGFLQDEALKARERDIEEVGNVRKESLLDKFVGSLFCSDVGSRNRGDWC